MSITHSTASDGTFSASGATAWDAAHTGDLPVSQLNGGTGASSSTFWRGDGTWANPGSNSGPTFPGGIPMTGVRYVSLTNTSVSTGDTDLYTVPANKRALIGSFQFMNNSGIGAIVWFVEVKVAGTYYRITNNATCNDGVASTNSSIGYIAEAGETIAINTTTNNGGCTIGQVIEFDDSVAIYSPKLLSLSAGDNTVYTVPASTSAYMLSSNLAPGSAAVGRFANSSGGLRTVQWKVTPNGGSLAACTASTAVGNGSTSSIFVTASLGAADSVQINTDAATATQMAWVSVMEI